MEINGGDICFGSTNFHLMILLKKDRKRKGRLLYVLPFCTGVISSALLFN